MTTPEPMTTHQRQITISTDQAERIRYLLTVSDDLIRTGAEQVRIDLARSLLNCDTDPVDVATFIDAVGFTARHLHAQLASARRAARHSQELAR